MSAKKQTVDNGRRKFLNGSALVGASAVAASVLPGVAVAATDTNQAEQAVEGPVEEGYRLTKHVQDYYKSAAS
jgi:nitrous oxide reductase